MWLSCFCSQLLHIVIIPLTVDCGIFSRHRWQAITVPGTMLEFTELLRATHSFTNVCKSIFMPRCLIL
ncbi:unnamed protein product [Staurois parvus]|uniref:Secreted protein n=1 Tax=Staurois parvus TaxID=386267 RepID=A0ABN9HLS2_9NEOB|nr:unnamed protein product [Staurois parvus]